MAHNHSARTASEIYHLLVVFALLSSIFFSIQCSKGNEPDVVDEEDRTAPSTVTDFHLVSLTTRTATFEWTAPGDDGDQGVAYEYDLRGSFDSITVENFAEQFRIDDLVIPLPAGYTQVCTVEDLEAGSTYFFAFTVRDDAGNYSGLSNCVRVDCPEDPVIIFPDPALDSIVRDLLDLPDDDLHVSDLDTIKEFYASNAGILDITGMQYMTGLTMLHLNDNPITDLTPLSTMTVLGGLNILATDVTDLSPLVTLKELIQIGAGHSAITDISPLSQLTKLRMVRLDDCLVTDFSPLNSLPNLEELDINNNPFENINFVADFTTLKIINLSVTQTSSLTPLSNLTNLQEIYLLFNQITDLTPLSGLTNLRVLDLRYNQIEDISPLLSNPGLGSGDELLLQNNPLSTESINTYIPALEARGIVVNH